MAKFIITDREFPYYSNNYIIKNNPAIYENSNASYESRTTDTQCNEGINQRHLKIWADVADKVCFGRKVQRDDLTCHMTSFRLR